MNGEQFVSMRVCAYTRMRVFIFMFHFTLSYTHVLHLRITYTETCQPYSEQACRDAATVLGLQVGSTGSSFASDYPTKGCYAEISGEHAGQAYYGTGGSVEDMQKELTAPGNKYRPRNYDCTGNHVVCVCLHVYMCTYVCIYVLACVCMYVCIDISMHVLSYHDYFLAR